MGLSEKLVEIKSEADALIQYANETTSAGDETLGDCIQTLIDGYGQGGGGFSIEPYGYLYDMFEAMQNGTARKFTFMHTGSTGIPGRTLLFSGGPDTINGFFCYRGSNVKQAGDHTLFSIQRFVDNSIVIDADATGSIYKRGFTLSTGLGIQNPSNTTSVGFTRVTSTEYVDGCLYTTPQYNGQANYTPFTPNVTYYFIVW